ncbi:DUF2634 domain-containing protein [Clostridiaceae bacterium M8S5]|nr:DUF2634 domain-containing protein [Clostridiaceae bacterium M8S5]
MMLPKITQLKFKEQKSKNLLKMGKSFLFDFDKGDFVVKDGRLVEANDVESLKVWIEKILRTQREKYLVYKRSDEEEYGVILEDLIIGNNYSHSFIESEIKREINSALMRNTIISSVSDFKIEKNNTKLKVYFKVNLINGKSFDEEVTV